jgi:hypothetical protein
MSAPRVITWSPINTTLIAPSQSLDSEGISGAMVAGVVTIPTTKVQAGSNIQLTMGTFGTAHGQWYVSAIVPGVSFTVTSTNATETSTVVWGIMPTSWAKGTSNPLGPGAVFVSAPSVTSNSNILLTYATNPGTTGGVLSAPIANIQPGIGFLIVSSNANDTAQVNWAITNLVAGSTSGTATLVAGTVTVATAAVASNSVILLSDNTLNTQSSYVRVSAIVNGTSFTITAQANTDISSINWAILPGGNLILNSKVPGQPQGAFIFDKVIRQVQLTSTADTSAATFTITGIGSPVDGNGNPTQVLGLISENLAGPTSILPNESANIYQQVISISANGPVSNISAGSGPAGITDFVFLNSNSVLGSANCSLQFVNFNAISASVYYSLNKPQIPDPNAGNLISSPFAEFELQAPIQANTFKSIPVPVAVVWANITGTTTDSINFTVLQQGVYP